MQVRQGRDYVALDPARGRRLSRAHGACGVPQVLPGDELRVIAGHLSDRATTRRAGGHGRILLSALWRESALTRAAENQLHAHADIGVAVVTVRRAVWRVLGCAALGASDSGSGRRYARRREGRLRFALAADLARRDGHPRAFVQRHDQAPREAARRNAIVSSRRSKRSAPNLAVILARLSTGVISLEPDRTIRTANQAACSDSRHGRGGLYRQAVVSDAAARAVAVRAVPIRL